MARSLIFKCYGFLISCVSILSYLSVVESRGVNGGIGCAVCTISLGIVEQLAELHNDTVSNISLNLCYSLPKKYQKPCIYVVDLLVPIITSPEIATIATPDVICYGIGMCHVDPGELYCNLFPKKNYNFHHSVQKVKNKLEVSGFPSFNICNLPLIKDVCADVYDWFEEMNPMFDSDGDRFSPKQLGRGSYWRGRDCLDNSSSSYPGHGSSDYDETYDSNCNGIFGVNIQTNVPYEKELCQSPYRGIIVVGDSVCARFRFPDAWMDPKMINESVFVNASDPLLDEFDWPQLGWGVGFMNSSDPFLVQGPPTDSIYLRMRERNRCIHRDYQNLCRNGDLTVDVKHSAPLISRNATVDHPVLLIYNVIGNDVCNNAKDTLANITTPTEYYHNVMEFLNQLPPRLPPGSHVILVGLVDGSFIYNAMSELYHPIGRLRKDVKYKDVYEWFTCMSIGPCNGWMTANDTLRKATTVKSLELSDVLKNISTNHNFPFGVHYVGNPINLVVNEMIKNNKLKDLWRLLEPVDSFHPNQFAQPMIAQTLWKSIMQTAPEAIGDANPNNDKINSLFGDQGGH